MRTAAVVLLLGTPLLADPVHFRTEDQIWIAADLHRVGENAPTVICLPMYRNVRSSYEPLLKPLADKGFNVLVLDLRGHGESTPALKPKVESRDPELFTAMHKDVAAAVAYLVDKGYDTSRIGIVGASVGCSVAVDYAVRHPGDVRAVALLTPGANYLGVPTLEHLKAWPGTASFLFSSFEEKATTEPVMEALKPFAAANHVYFELEGIHGTRMFGKVEGIEQLIANWMESTMLRSVDLAVPQWKSGDPAPGQPGFFRKVLGPRRKVGNVRAQVMAWVVGTKLRVGVLVDGPFLGKLSCELDEARFTVPFDTANPLGGMVISLREKRGACPSQGSAGGTSWIEVDIGGDASEWTRLALTMQPAEG